MHAGHSAAHTPHVEVMQDACVSRGYALLYRSPCTDSCRQVGGLYPPCIEVWAQLPYRDLEADGDGSCDQVGGEEPQQQVVQEGTCRNNIDPNIHT
jgi:hypothetical protein